MNTRLSQRKLALITGIALVLMAVTAGISYGYIHSSLFHSDDLSLTISNLEASPTMLLVEIFAWLITLILDIIVTWSLYLYFKKYHESYAILVALLRLAYSTLLGGAVSQLIMLTTPQGIGVDQLAFQLNAFDKIWNFGLIIFDFHLIMLALLILKEIQLSNIISGLLMIAGISYVLSSFLIVFMPQTNFSLLENILSIPMAIGKLSLAIWLLFKGGKVVSSSGLRIPV